VYVVVSLRNKFAAASDELCVFVAFTIKMQLDRFEANEQTLAGHLTFGMLKFHEPRNGSFDHFSLQHVRASSPK